MIIIIKIYLEKGNYDLIKIFLVFRPTGPPFVQNKIPNGVGYRFNNRGSQCNHERNVGN